jgi:hypothetical protein
MQERHSHLSRCDCPWLQGMPFSYGSSRGFYFGFLAPDVVELALERERFGGHAGVRITVVVDAHDRVLHCPAGADSGTDLEQACSKAGNPCVGGGSGIKEHAPIVPWSTVDS